MWTPPKIQKQESLEKMQQHYEKMDVQLVNQRYVQTPKQQKEMFLGKIANHMGRLGGRYEGQYAKTKQEMKEIKFDEVDKILDSLAPRYENQRMDSSKKIPMVEEGNVNEMTKQSSFVARPTSPVTEVERPKPVMKQVSNVTKSQELDGMADMLYKNPRLNSQAAQASQKAIVTVSEKVVVAEVTKSQELDEVAAMLYKNPRLNSQAAKASRKSIMTASEKVIVPEVTRSQELDQVADMLYKNPRLNSQAAEVKPAGLLAAEKVAELESLPVANTKLPQESATEPVAC
jgi:hypothetical protein